PFADKPVEPLEFAPSFGRIWPAVDEANAQDRARALERRVGIGRTIIEVHPLGRTPTLNGGAQHVLAGARVLVSRPTSVQDQPRVIVQENEQVRATAGAGARIRDER